MTAELVNKIQLSVHNKCAWVLTTVVHSTAQIKTGLELWNGDLAPTQRSHTQGFVMQWWKEWSDLTDPRALAYCRKETNTSSEVNTDQTVMNPGPVYKSKTRHSHSGLRHVAMFSFTCFVFRSLSLSDCYHFHENRLQSLSNHGTAYFHKFFCVWHQVEPPSASCMCMYPHITGKNGITFYITFNMICTKRKC